MQRKPSCVVLVVPEGTGHHKKACRSGMDFHLRNSSYALSLAASPGRIHSFRCSLSRWLLSLPSAHTD